MSILPGPAQTTAIALGVAFPLILFGYAQISSICGAGRRFRIGSITAATLFVIACFVLPGHREIDDVLGGVLLLLTAIEFWYVVWGLLAWGFTLTLLTSLASVGRPLTKEQWIAAYMQGGNLSVFAHNRLRVLLGAAMVVSTAGKIVVTPLGVVTIRLVRFVRLAMGLDRST